MIRSIGLGDSSLGLVFLASELIPQGTNLDMGTIVITPPNSDIYLKDKSLSLKIKLKGLIPQSTKQTMGIDLHIKSLYPKTSPKTRSWELLS